MSEKPENPQAFAHAGIPSNFKVTAQKGMTLRDYFAAKAMQALLSQTEGACDWTDDKIAKWSYDSADAMLHQRSKE